MLSPFNSKPLVLSVLLLALLYSCAFSADNSSNGKWCESGFICCPSKDNFTFAILADTHVGDPESSEAGARNTYGKRNSLVEGIAKEINALHPLPDFVVFNGDLTEKPLQSSFAKFTELAGLFKPKPVLVFGNHDGTRDPSFYLESQKQLNGCEKLYYSFNAGKWHFAVLPTPAPNGEEVEAVSWLDRDLQTNKHKPVVVLMHFHLLPIGLSQLEFYSYNLPLRKQYLDTITKYGNVKYVFIGHVHNGFKPSVKTAWEYKGAKFISVPTVVPSRNFGEEYPEYADALMSGGYYLIVRVDGENVTLTGRLLGNDKPFEYPRDFKKYDPCVDPRAFARLPELPATPQLKNGGFEDGLRGWHWPYRYIADELPGFEWKASPEAAKTGKNGAFLLCRAKQGSWQYDEFTEIYQILDVATGENPVINFSYKVVSHTPNSGGYVRIHTYDDSKEMKCLFMFKWNKNEERLMRLPSVASFIDTGDRHPPTYFSILGQSNRALFVDIPSSDSEWHTITANLGDLYKRGMPAGRSFQDLNIKKMALLIGVWANKDLGTVSSAYFDDISVSFSNTEKVSDIDGQIIYPKRDFISESSLSGSVTKPKINRK